VLAWLRVRSVMLLVNVGVARALRALSARSAPASPLARVCALHLLCAASAVPGCRVSA
jgi:hypothetical protein